MGQISRRLLRSLHYSALVILFLPAKVQGQWLEKPLHGWLQVSLYHHDTTNRFDPQGHVEPLFNEGGRSITTSVFLTGVLGIINGLDVWGQLPIHRLAFNDISADRESFGFGDPLLHVRISPELAGIKSPVPLAIRGGVKLSLGDFPIDSEIVPLTQGQRDWELMVELGHSFYPAPVYTMGWIGYRWRETNHEIERKPGDERFAFFAVGGQYKKLSWKVSAEGIWGKKWISFTGVRIPLAFSERRLVQIMPSVGWQVAGGSIELGGRLPVAGRNLPAGPALFLGYFVRVGKK